MEVSLSQTPEDMSRTLSSNETSLVPTYIQSVPWQDGFTFGHGNGVDAITGYLAPSAVEPFEAKLSQVKRSKESFRLLLNEIDLEEEIAASAGVSLNIDPVGSLFGGSSLTSKAKVSATSFSILGTYVALFEPFDLARDYKMTTEAIDFARTSPNQFRARYGDYFVAGGQRSSIFTALLMYSSKDVLSLKTFSTKVHGRLHELFTVEGSIQWARAATEANIHVEVEVEMHGYLGEKPPSAPWDTSKIVEALSWFKEHEVGVYRNARLHHYSTLNFDLPRTVYIQYHVFGKIRSLHYLLSALTVLVGSCPEHEDRASLRRQVVYIREEVETRQAELAVDLSTLQGFLGRAEDLRERLQTLHQRYRFILHVQTQVSTQPTIRTVASKNLRHWTYGCLKYHLDSTIRIESTSQRLTVPPTLTIFHREGTLTYSTPASDRLIVGWEVVSHRVDGHNGSWRRLSRNILLDTSGSITFRTRGFRRVDWELITYHVDASLFNFSASVNGPGASDKVLGDSLAGHYSPHQYSTSSPPFRGPALIAEKEIH
jgi:hypothetical protein